MSFITLKMFYLKTKIHLFYENIYILMVHLTYLVKFESTCLFVLCDDPARAECVVIRCLSLVTCVFPHKDLKLVEGGVHMQRLHVYVYLEQGREFSLLQHTLSIVQRPLHFHSCMNYTLLLVYYIYYFNYKINIARGKFDIRCLFIVLLCQYSVSYPKS